MAETKNWLVTGASSGFGRLLTEKALQRGDRVAATVRRVDALDDLVERHGDALHVVTLDVTDTAAVRQGVDGAFDALGRIDVVVSNAGYGLFGAAEELDDAEIVRQIDTNLVGSIAVIRSALPHLRAQGGGRMLQVSSEGGQVTYPNFSLYHATKWGIEGFVESVAQEVGTFDIRFTLVEPGPAGTRFAAGISSAEPMEVYAGTPSGNMRRALSDGSFEIIGDPAKMVDAMIACADSDAPPARLVLGSSSYTGIRATLKARIAELDEWKETAISTDRDGAGSTFGQP